MIGVFVAPLNGVTQPRTGQRETWFQKNEMSQNLPYSAYKYKKRIQYIRSHPVSISSDHAIF